MAVAALAAPFFFYWAVRVPQKKAANSIKKDYQIQSRSRYQLFQSFPHHSDLPVSPTPPRRPQLLEVHTNRIPNLSCTAKQTQGDDAARSILSFLKSAFQR